MGQRQGNKFSQTTYISTSSQQCDLPLSYLQISFGTLPCVLLQSLCCSEMHQWWLSQRIEMLLWRCMGTLLGLLFFLCSWTKKFHQVLCTGTLVFHFFFFFESLCGFGFGFFPNCSLKITNIKNPSCVGVWLKMEKFSGSVLNSDQEFCVGSQQTSVSSVQVPKLLSDRPFQTLGQSFL